MLYALLQVIGGLSLLYLAGEGLVRGASGLARGLGISPTVIGLTIVAYGTSAPELAVSIVAAVENHPQIVLGNVIGSNIFNISMVIGLAAILRPIMIERDFMKTYGAFLIFSTVMFFVLVGEGFFNRLDGVLMLVMLTAYTVWLLRRQSGMIVLKDQAESRKIKQMIALVAGGIIGLYFGSELLVDGVVELALLFNLGEDFLGLTIVAAGTGTPELASSIVAAYRKEHGITVGNIAGSNIFNILGIIGSSSAVAPIEIPTTIYPSYFFMTALTVALLAEKRRSLILGRTTGIAFLAVYVVFLSLISNWLQTILGL